MKAVFLATYAPHALKGIIQGSDREAAVKGLIESVGGKYLGMMFTRGEYDVVINVEVPDQPTTIGLNMAVLASGAFTKLIALEELDMKPVLAAAKKAAATYKPVA
jgi:uncharacterized protein with GYD domain